MVSLPLLPVSVVLLIAFRDASDRSNQGAGRGENTAVRELGFGTRSTVTSGVRFVPVLRIVFDGLVLGGSGTTAVDSFWNSLILSVQL